MLDCTSPAPPAPGDRRSHEVEAGAARGRLGGPSVRAPASLSVLGGESWFTVGVVAHLASHGASRAARMHSAGIVVRPHNTRHAVSESLQSLHRVWPAAQHACTQRASYFASSTHACPARPWRVPRAPCTLELSSIVHWRDSNPESISPRRADIKIARDLVIRLKIDRHSSSLTDEISRLSDTLEARLGGVLASVQRACVGILDALRSEARLHAAIISSFPDHNPSAPLQTSPLLACAWRAGLSCGLHALSNGLRQSAVPGFENPDAGGLRSPRSVLVPIVESRCRSRRVMHTMWLCRS